MVNADFSDVSDHRAISHAAMNRGRGNATGPSRFGKVIRLIGRDSLTAKILRLLNIQTIALYESSQLTLNDVSIVMVCKFF